jgi:hypothetical protein
LANSFSQETEESMLNALKQVLRWYTQAK